MAIAAVAICRPGPEADPPDDGAAEADTGASRDPRAGEPEVVTPAAVDDRDDVRAAGDRLEAPREGERKVMRNPRPAVPVRRSANVAITVFAASTVTVQVPVPEHRPPEWRRGAAFHPRKSSPAVAMVGLEFPTPCGVV